jgi:hypothetical protein
MGADHNGSVWNRGIEMPEELKIAVYNANTELQEKVWAYITCIPFFF